MTGFVLDEAAAALPPAHRAIVGRLEDAGVECWLQGDALLEAGFASGGDSTAALLRSRSFLCTAPAATLLEALPAAVVTAESGRRLTLGTEAGPLDLIPVAAEPLPVVLRRFGLSALAVALRPLTDAICDPTDARTGLARRSLDVVSPEPMGDPADVFRVAPRRYWITARLLAEHELRPSRALLDAATRALPDLHPQIPAGAPARRELERIFVARDPTKGLSFLREVGLCDALFPGMDPGGAELVRRLESGPSLRWAVWLEGASTQRALRDLRMPISRAREIERLLRHHPVDRTTAARSAGEAPIRRLRQRLHPEEIDGLLRWRRLQLEAKRPSENTRRDLDRLEEIRAELDALESDQRRIDRIRSLAVDGERVMALLGRGPGRHIGQALAHLAAIVAADPSANERSRLEAELRRWAEQPAHPRSNP